MSVRCPQFFYLHTIKSNSTQNIIKNRSSQHNVRRNRIKPAFLEWIQNMAKVKLTQVNLIILSIKSISKHLDILAHRILAVRSRNCAFNCLIFIVGVLNKKC